MATPLAACGAWLLLQLWVVQAVESCTKGRLFVADANVAKVHVLDLDANFAVLASLDAPIPAARLASTSSNRATIMSIDRGTTAEGTVHFYRPGLVAEAHGDHMDVIKSTPSAYAYSLTGWKPTHVTFSAGHVGVFMDGVWSADVSQQVMNSSAVFIKENTLAAASPVVVEVPLESAHHGVAFALSDTHFLTSVATQARMMREDGASSLPGYFILTDSTGATLQELGNETSPSCPAYHGSAHDGNANFMMGCGTGGWLRVTYNSAASEPLAGETVPYPSPVPDKAFRSGNVRSHSTGMYFTDLYMSDRTPAPRYLTTILAAGSEAKTVQVTRSTTENDVCHWGVDMATENGGTHLAVLSKDGYMSVSEVSASGVLGTMVLSDIFGGQMVCSDTSMVPGHGVMYVLVAGANPRVLQVNLAEILAGHGDHAVASTTLSFTPAGASLALPPSIACQPPSHNENSSNAAPKGVASLVAMFLSFMLLWR